MAGHLCRPVDCIIVPAMVWAGGCRCRCRRLRGQRGDFLSRDLWRVLHSHAGLVRRGCVFRVAGHVLWSTSMFKKGFEFTVFHVPATSFLFSVFVGEEYVSCSTVFRWTVVSCISRSAQQLPQHVCYPFDGRHMHRGDQIIIHRNKNVVFSDMIRMYGCGCYQQPIGMCA